MVYIEPEEGPDAILAGGACLTFTDLTIRETVEEFPMFAEMTAVHVSTRGAFSRSDATHGIYIEELAYLLLVVDQACAGVEADLTWKDLSNGIELRFSSKTPGYRKRVRWTVVMTGRLWNEGEGDGEMQSCGGFAEYSALDTFRVGLRTMVLKYRIAREIHNEAKEKMAAVAPPAE